MGRYLGRWAERWTNGEVYGVMGRGGSDMEVYGGWESSGKLLLSLRNRRNVDYSNIGRQKKPSSSSLDQQHITKRKFLTITASIQM